MAHGPLLPLLHSHNPGPQGSALLRARVTASQSPRATLVRAGVTASRSPRVTLLRPLSQPEITAVPQPDRGIWAGAQHGSGRAAGSLGVPRRASRGHRALLAAAWLRPRPQHSRRASSVPSIRGVPWPAGQDPSRSRRAAPGAWQQGMTIMRPDPEDVPRLDLGKKVSTPQDLMIEELSLRNNRGSQLFQQRQRRMQRFVFEHPSGYRKLPGLGVGGSRCTEKGDPEGTANEWMAGEDAGDQQTYHSELHVAALPQGGPPEVPKKTEKVLQMSKVLNPDALAPGYSGPLKEVPPEKFNVTAIPKGYRSPWQELLSDKDNTVHGKNQPPVRPSPWDFKSFNRTPAPFDRALVSDLFSVPAVDLDNLSVLEVISHRPNFNRAAQGWVRILPESDDL
ncbi:myozenin-3 isoform 1-T1 [Ciconia maguari]